MTYTFYGIYILPVGVTCYHTNSRNKGLEMLLKAWGSKWCYLCKVSFKLYSIVMSGGKFKRISQSIIH